MNTDRDQENATPNAQRLTPMNEFVSYNPKTEEVAGVYPAATATDVVCAMEKAHQAAKDWERRSVGERMERLRHWRDWIGQEADTLASVVAKEIGKPLQEAYGADILPTWKALDWLTKYAPRALRDRRIPGARRAVQMAQPYGVVGVIGTWNYPVYLNVAPIAWALAAGNAVIWKPSELATETALRLAAQCERIGLPVFVVIGGAETGRAVCWAGCDKVAFTGGVATGRAILAELAALGTPSVMELSGNDALIVCRDADLERTARSAVWARVCNAGQSCVAPQRIYVAQEVYAPFVQRCRELLEGLRPDCDFSPLRTEALRDRTHRLVQDAVARGASLVCGGKPLCDRPGFYYAPTLLADCDDAMPVMADDFFGPVLAVSAVQEEEAAIERANASDMALGASVWTRDTKRGFEIARQLKVGLVSINDVLLDAAEPGLPFGGLKASGFGKQRGLAGLEEFVQWKTVVSHSPGGARRHLFPYRLATLPILRGVMQLLQSRRLRDKIHAGRELSQAAMAWRQEEE